MYSFLIYTKPNFSKNIVNIKQEMELFFEKFEEKPIFYLKEEELKISYNDYNFYIAINDEPYILEELSEILEEEQNDYTGNPINKNEIIQSKYRFELWGDDDFDMDYFNESLFIIEFFESDSNYVIFEVN
jgi:hypothetical protein